jgi:hypothetical protein
LLCFIHIRLSMAPLLLQKPLYSTTGSNFVLGTRTYSSMYHSFHQLANAGCQGYRSVKIRLCGWLPGFNNQDHKRVLPIRQVYDISSDLFISLSSVDLAAGDRCRVIGTVILSSPGVFCDPQILR